jgi:hypothetical protein
MHCPDSDELRRELEALSPADRARLEKLPIVSDDLQVESSRPTPADQSEPSGDVPRWELPNGSWDLVYSYSRAQAIDDGVLVDCGIFTWGGRRVIDLLGFKYPVAITAAAYGQITEGCEAGSSDHKVALAGCLSALLQAIRLGSDDDRIHFKCNPAFNHTATVELWSLCGPGDTADPVLTIMLEGED